MNTNRKKAREVRLVREFLEHLSIRHEDLHIEPWTGGSRQPTGSSPGPDVKVRCLIGGEWRFIGVEVTEYQVDARPKKGSQAREFATFFRRLRSCLEPLLARSPQLAQFCGQLYFDWESSPRQREAQQLAEQIVQFLRARCLGIRPEVPLSFRRKRGPMHGGVFDLPEFSLLKRYFSEIIVTRHDQLRGPFLWSYNSAAHVGVNEKALISRMKKKQEEQESYDWSNTSERWLLICSGIGIPHDSAGSTAPRSDEISACLRAAAQQSGFGRVVLWERRAGWHVDLLG